MPIRTVVSWNVNGIRAWLKKDIQDFFTTVDPDVLCVQETKAKPEQVDLVGTPLEQYSHIWYAADRPGYSGVATFSKEPPDQTEQGMGIEDFDVEGRLVVSRFGDIAIYNVYVPNGGKGPERVVFKLEFYDALLKLLITRREKGEKQIVLGDLNTAYAEIDLSRPKENQKTTGFMPEERAWIQKFYDAGYIDSFRMFHSESERYTWWDMKTRARDRNIGWRIDYILISDLLKKDVFDADHLDTIYGSDHCPLYIKIKM